MKNDQKEKQKPKKEYKFDIFAALAACDNRDGSWYSSLTEEQIKEFSPYMLLRWMSSVGNTKSAARILIQTNEILNNNMNAYDEEHPELAFRLAAMCGTGKQQFHKLLKAPGRQAVSNKARELLIRFNPLANDEEIDLLIKLYTRESFAQFVIDAGMTDAEYREVMIAYDKISEKEPD